MDDLEAFARMKDAEFEAWHRRMAALPKLPKVCPRCGGMFVVKPLTTEPVCWCKPDL